MEAKLRNFKSYLIYCMEAELRNFKAALFSLCGSGISPFQSSKSHIILYAEAELYVSVYSLCGGGTSSQRIFHVWKRNCRTSSLIIVCVWKRNFKSHNSLYVESLWFLMQQSEVPGSAGPKAPVSKPSWRYCSQLCHLGGGPYWDCFSLLRSYQA